jgi:transketolase
MMSLDPGVSIYKGFNVMLSLSDGEIENLAAVARRVRLRLLDIFSACGKGHYGGCYSVTDILVMLYGKVLRVDPARPCWADRDRLILSKGHTNAALCAVLGHHGFFDEAELATYAETDSRYGMHPDMHCVVGCDMSSGSLGHGLAVGIGMALAGRADGKGYRVYVVLSDGECNEGSVWEAAMVASHHKLDNMIAIVDRNRLSLDGPTEEILTLEPLAEKWRSFGWSAIEVNGHDFRQLFEGLEQAQRTRGRPTVLVAKTVKGKGVSFMEDNPSFHSGSLTDQQLEIAKAELMGGGR